MIYIILKLGIFHQLKSTKNLILFQSIGNKQLYFSCCNFLLIDLVSSIFSIIYQLWQIIHSPACPTKT